ncbi:hypothetical protein CDO46_09535 [Pigmentiphaga sp. NML030171]|nr:hypothetical protein CDO46_09535 [Pigmentiphaga sp. NML030171]
MLCDHRKILIPPPPMPVRSPSPAALPPIPTDATPPPATGESAVGRLLTILDLFTADNLQIQVDEVAAWLGVGRSTCYRYLQELSDRGLLAQRGKGRYSLGSRIVELERLLQQSDPLLNAGKSVMAGMADICDNRALLLCTLYNDRVLCTHQVGSSHIIHEGERMPLYRGRGSAFPLFQGAGSQAILANLAPHQIRALYLAKQAEIAESGLGQDWQEFRSALATIRKQGYVATVGKRNPRILALAVPVRHVDGQVMGSLLLLTAHTEAERAQALALVPRLQAEAARIGEFEQRLSSGDTVPPAN